MLVNGLKLPDAFVALIDRPEPLLYWIPKGGNEGWSFKGGEGGVYWVRKDGLEDDEAEGDDFLDDLELFPSLAGLEEASKRLPDDFHVAEYTPEEIDEWNAEYDHLPGFIPFITDYSQIVVLGETPCAERYCFDYRENLNEPSTIHWDDAYWRRVAPNFQYFIDLFEPYDTTAARRDSVREMETANLREALPAMEQRLTAPELPEPRRADLENWAVLYREELEARASHGEEPGGDGSGEGQYAPPD